ncbi:hypothetical protein HW555_013688 [Spodoptera exigua]|uniref:Uncharacterized protein n=1 Tax=Spodoptera exigua TaxID=7107 RepID=A0A835G3N3_SPOEX|nr:hypothetical protein HW555_013688 [Spodoptera exigua]
MQGKKMMHGKKNEHTAIAALQKKLNVVIEECGLFIDDEFPFLGATPDGKYEHGIIEVNCELWAKYCFPDKEYWSPEFQHKLYTEHKMLCNRHFPRTSFSDYPESCKKLHRYAVPDDNKECQITWIRVGKLLRLRPTTQEDLDFEAEYLRSG